MENFSELSWEEKYLMSQRLLRAKNEAIKGLQFEIGVLKSEVQEKEDALLKITAELEQYKAMESAGKLDKAFNESVKKEALYQTLLDRIKRRNETIRRLKNEYFNK